MFDLTSNTTLMTSLACAALNPGLRSILVLDPPSTDDLQSLADIMAELLRATTGQYLRQYYLNAFESDDDVWGALYLPSYNTESTEEPAHRLFSAERNASELQLITIPDLTTLSLAALRTITVLVGADVVHLERNGLSACWHPQQCWIAGCPENAIGKLSPHLLDRFALRFSWKDIVLTSTRDDLSAVAHLLARVPQEPDQEKLAVPATYLQQVTQAAHRQVDIPISVLAHILNYLPSESYYPRREIALVRFAQTLAQFYNAPSLQAAHIDEAAHMLGFTWKLASPEPTKQTETTPIVTEELLEEETAQSTMESVESLQQEVTQPRTAQLPEATYTTLIESGKVCSNPYPEDEASIEREEFALKVPPMRSVFSRSIRGAIIGVEESDTLFDLALVSTILAAMKFQKVRQDECYKLYQKIYAGLLIEPTDLRRYRRSLPTEQIFMLLFDYTSIREDNDWEDVLVEYLHEAYTARASIAIIKVGADDASSWLRAEVVNGKNILVPRIGRALETRRGQATPLAHGLSLALEQLQRMLQHGRTTARKVTFVVISDGRGNVPLMVSMRDKQDAIVTREGIDEALREARKIRALKHVDSTVLNPQPDYYPDLPGRLAEALGARLLPIPRRSIQKEVLS